MSTDTVMRDEAIGQFCGVTGADEERAKSLLEACDWNLELAINMHVDTDDGTRVRPSTSSGPSNSDRGNRNSSFARASNPGTKMNNDDDDNIDADDEFSNSKHSTAGTSMFSPDIDSVRPPIPPVRQILVQHPPSYGADMPHRRYSTRVGPSTDAHFDAFRDFQAEYQFQEQVASESEGNSASLAAEIASRNNTNSGRTLNDLFRPPLALMHRGHFASAREAGVTQNRWLLVNIQDSREFACQILNRDVWSNQTVQDIIKEHFIFWQMQQDNSEGAKYVQFYKVRRYPHVSIIDPRTGEELKSWPSSIDQSSFCESVIEFLTEHPSPDGSCDANKMKKLRVKEDEDAAKTLYDQSEEAQLEAAIRASLQENKASNDESADLDGDLDVIEVKNNVKPKKHDQSSTILITDDDDDDDDVVATDGHEGDDEETMNNIDLDETSNQSSVQSFSSSECTCKIALRFPDGTSCVQKFSPQERLAAVRRFVRKQKKNVSQIEFVAPPNKKLTNSMMKETLENLGLAPASRLEVMYETGK